MSAHLDRVAAALLAMLLTLVAIAFGLFEAAGLEGAQWPVVAAMAVVGALIARTRLLGPLLVATILAVIVLGTIAVTPVAGALARPYIRRDPSPPAPVDAIVVLSAWLNDDGYLNQDGLDRLLRGAELYRRGAAPLLVLSRVRNGGRTSDQDQQRILRLLGDTVRTIVVDDVHGTRDEALRVAAMRPSIRRVALVTSPLHSRRACATFERAGLQVVCAPSENREFALLSQATATDRVHTFRGWVYEALATTLYRSRGWVR